MIQFWFLWLFIAIVVVLVAFTLRKERDDMPRTDILRAVETSAGSMGLAEKDSCGHSPGSTPDSESKTTGG